MSTIAVRTRTFSYLLSKCAAMKYAVLDWISFLAWWWNLPYFQHHITVHGSQGSYNLLNRGDDFVRPDHPVHGLPRMRVIKAPWVRGRIRNTLQWTRALGSKVAGLLARIPPARTLVMRVLDMWEQSPAARDFLKTVVPAFVLSTCMFWVKTNSMPFLDIAVVTVLTSIGVYIDRGPR